MGMDIWYVCMMGVWMGTCDFGVCTYYGGVLLTYLPAYYSTVLRAIVSRTCGFGEDGWMPVCFSTRRQRLTWLVVGRTGSSSHIG